jgi:hypothetical protein
MNNKELKRKSKKIKIHIYVVRKFAYVHRNMIIFQYMIWGYIITYLGIIAPLVIGVGLNYKSLLVVQKVHGGFLL